MKPTLDLLLGQELLHKHDSGDVTVFTGGSTVDIKAYVDNTVGALPKPLTYKGTLAADFSYLTLTGIQVGWMYVVKTNGIKDTNFPLITYLAEDEIVWLGSSWDLLGNATSGLQVANNLSDVANPALSLANINGQAFHGFVNQIDSVLPETISSISAFALTTLSGYVIYVGGNKYTISTSKSVSITNTLGQWFVYFQIDAGIPTLHASQVGWSILDTTIIPVATIYWDGTTGWVGEERHAHNRNLQFHYQAHNDWGAQYRSGFVGATFGSSANNTLSIPAGETNDEDIVNVISGTQTQCALGYRVAGGATFTFQVGTVYSKVVSLLPQWDNNGTLTPLSNNNYGVTYIYATNRKQTNGKLVGIVGQGDYPSLALAQAAPLPSLPSFSVAEWKLIYRVYYRRVTGALLFVQSDPMYAVSTGLVVNAGAPSTISAANVTYIPTTPLTATNIQTALDQAAAALATGGGGLTYLVQGGGTSKISTAVTLAHNTLAGTGKAIVYVEAGLDYIENGTNGITMYGDVSIVYFGKPKVIRTVAGYLYTNFAGITEFNVTGDAVYSCDYGLCSFYTQGSLVSVIHEFYSATCISGNVLYTYFNNALAYVWIECTYSNALQCFDMTGSATMCTLLGNYVSSNNINSVASANAYLDAAIMNNLSILCANVEVGRINGNCTINGINAGTIINYFVIDMITGNLTINSDGYLGFNAIIGNVAGVITAVGVDPVYGPSSILDIMSCGSLSAGNNLNVHINNTSGNLTCGNYCTVTVDKISKYGGTINVSSGTSSQINIDYLAYTFLSNIGTVAFITLNAGRLRVKDVAFEYTGDIKDNYYDGTPLASVFDLIKVTGGTLILDNSKLLHTSANVTTTVPIRGIHFTANAKMITIGTPRIVITDITYGVGILVDTGITVSVTNIGPLFSRNAKYNVGATYTELIASGGTYTVDPNITY